MEIFYLKYRDTYPILQVILKNPDGSVHDLTGATGFKLHISLSSGVRLVRSMVKIGLDTDGTLKYEWIASDWAAASVPDVDGAYTIGGLTTGPSLPLSPGTREHRMEYEVIGPSTGRLTFPNGGANAEESYHTLRIWSDIGQG